MSIFCCYGLGFRIALSKSLPGWIYQVYDLKTDLQIGDYVVVDFKAFAPKLAKELANNKGYMHLANSPMIKQISGMPGDLVDYDRDHEELIFNSTRRTKAFIRNSDSHGQTLPVLKYPVRLDEGEYWLTSDPQSGFDSRYFGPVRSKFFLRSAKLII